ncbi:hypothetical protein [Halobacterium sp. CBA1126]|uniref:hypothetical protein n=1 Tax=Halobacterium sp. CBA1126 TaxID=2668074 RepID=UPI0012F83868|nr:hypothetical protein [Halobacterium sp. CBA1126]MUV60506.1 hypothetical protein [Halobacterium sp. CBA1126]
MPPNTTRPADGPTGRTGTETPRSASGFPVPPVEFRDDEDRRVSVRAAGPGDFDALAAMYDDFGAESRAQRIPPVDEHRRRDWLETLLADGWDVLAAHDGATFEASLTADAAAFAADGDGR